MRCPHCKAYVPFDSKLKKCAACGSIIERKPVMEDVLNMFAELAAEKNFIFWGFSAMIAGLIIGGIEFAVGKGDLLSFFEGKIFYSIIIFIYWGFIVDLMVKANAQIRIASKTLILKERRILRIFRMGTNLSLVTGILLSIVWIGPDRIFECFAGLTMITTATICFYWALEGMFFREDHFEDHRVRNFFRLLGVRHPHPYRVASAYYLAGIILALVIYWGLVLFPSIFINFYNTWFVQSTIKFVLEFLSYFPSF